MGDFPLDDGLFQTFSLKGKQKNGAGFGRWSELCSQNPGDFSLSVSFCREVFLPGVAGWCRLAFRRRNAFMFEVRLSNQQISQQEKKYHGTPRFLHFLGAITHILGVENLHFSWFCGPRVG